MNALEFLGGFAHDSVTNSLQQPDAAIPVLEATVFPLTSIALYTGPRPVYITHLMVSFQDIAVTDPSSDLHLGWSLQSAADGTGSPTYSALAGYTANADLPLIHDNSASTTAIQAVANIPVNLMKYVGSAGGAATYYATRAGEDAITTGGRTPIRIAAHTLFQVRLGTYEAGSLTAVTGLDNVFVAVYGHRV